MYLNLQGAGFYTIEQVANPNERFNPAVGYLHLDKALTATDDVRAKLLLDFNREHDGPIYDDSPNLAAPVLTHDLYVASGPELAGTFRAYRNDVPMLFDAQQGSDLLGGVIGLDIGGGLIAKFGASGSLNGTKSLIGGWDGGNSGALQSALKAVAPAPAAADPRWERTYFKMIGEPVRASPASALPGGESPVAIPVKAAPFDLNNLPPDFFTATHNSPVTATTRFRSPSTRAAALLAEP